MKKGFFLSVLFYLFFLLPARVSASEMKAINFTQKGEISELEFIFDNNDVQASKFQVKEDKQIIVDLTDVAATDRVMRAFDTSEFSGGVVFVKAYKKPKADKDIRVAVQLRDNVRSTLVRKPNKVILQIENRYGVFSQKKAEEGQSYKEKIANISKDEATRLNIPKSDSIEDILDNLTMSGRKKYIGKKITMNLKNVKPEEIVRIIAETSGFNIILTEDAKALPPISLSLVDIPWDQALDTVLEMSKLVAKKNGMILIVNTLENAIKEQEELKKAKIATLEQEPLLTKVFPISFANIDDLQKILAEYSTDKRGKISKDSRTNSLIVKDTSDVIEKVKKIVELLDTQTPQVLIESKIVEVSERYTKEIGLDQGLTFGYDPLGVGGSSGNNGSFSFSTAPAAGRNIFGLSIGKFNRLIDLNFRLNLMESEAKAKIISSPKVITKNNVKAEIVQDENSYYQVQTLAENGRTTNTWTLQNAKLKLEVTPQITNEGAISLEVAMQKDSLEPSSDITTPRNETKRTVKTQVLVDNGATVVVGGIYTYTTDESHSGVPFLKDIPLVGWLFRTKYNPRNEKKELIIFLTPRIINQEEAGLVDRG
ncbi:type IV pilus assembly protein PilQ [Bacteriovorax stolpii]|nr:type IV pilus secretin PilQ [Bacteriovorax stolpii]TDP53831.1 type IV pilus assembly protein PilQ [Bacteriovorax stolpii]